jgi:hypothetical protein
LSICHACRGFGSSAQVISLASHGVPPDFTIHPSMCRGGSRTVLPRATPYGLPQAVHPRLSLAPRRARSRRYLSIVAVRIEASRSHAGRLTHGHCTTYLLTASHYIP